MLLAINMTEKIKQIYPEYFIKHTYVFKSCNKNWIIVMKKNKHCKTNEERFNIKNIKHALYKGDRFHVTQIFNKLEPEITINKITEKYYDGEITFYENDFICDIFADCDKNSYSNKNRGILFFKSVVSAFYSDIPDEYTGPYIGYHNNGMITTIGEHKNGKKHGEWSVDVDKWYMSRIEYKNGKELLNKL
jgi:hypothetical protein